MATTCARTSYSYQRERKAAMSRSMAALKSLLGKFVDSSHFASASSSHTLSLSMQASLASISPTVSAMMLKIVVELTVAASRPAP